MVLMRLGLKAALLKQGLSQREAGRLASIPESRLSSIVRGWTRPTPEERARLAAVLHHDELTLFDTKTEIDIRSGRR
jgi:transcriptional regulator with XRE-family HTH domain